MTGIIRAPRPLRDYFDVHNATARDPHLSYRARGVLLRLLSNMDGYRMTSHDLAREGKEGRGAILSALRELRAAGYIRVQKTQDPRGRWLTMIYVYDTPQNTEVNTEVQKPDPGLPDAGFFDATKNNQQNNQQQNPPPPSRGAAAANKVKTRRLRASGIVTWTTDDVIAAKQIEASTPPENLRAAVAATTARGKEPVPGLVEQQILALAKTAARVAQQSQLTVVSRAAKARTKINGLQTLLSRTADPATVTSLRTQLDAAQAELARLKGGAGVVS